MIAHQTVKSRYVLVTAAHNEANYIERTIQSVIAQTIQPVKWVIVCDRSTDATEEIIRWYATKHSFIVLVVRKAGSLEYDLRSKVLAFKDGHARLADVAYDFIGNLDADIELVPDYYARLLEKFMENPYLGLAGAGTLVEEHKGRWVPCFDNTSRRVPGAVQLMRRQCYEEVDGFIPIKYGGADTIIQVMIRMHGWHVKSLSEICVRHLRVSGTATGKVLMQKFRLGLRDHAMGNHPLYEGARCARRLAQGPVLLGSLAVFFGYLWGRLTTVPVPPHDVVAYLRREQLARLWATIIHPKPGQG